MPRKPAKPSKPARPPTKPSNPPQLLWRDIDPALKLKILANFFGDVSALSKATGIKSASLRQTLRASNSKKFSTGEYREGIKHARKLMTDRMRYINAEDKKGEYLSRVVQLGPTLIEPKAGNNFIQSGKQTVEVKSFWTRYNVEHLPRHIQIESAVQLIIEARQSGQFNVFRFEYLTDGREYIDTGIPPRRTFRDDDLRYQLKQDNRVKISTRVQYIPQMGDDGYSIADYLQDMLNFLIPRGLIDVLELCFSKQENYAEMDKRVPKFKQGKKAWGNKRGK